MHASTYLSLVIRISIALLTRTFFQPDEYFQALEPAHHFVFGYGIRTWEWTTQHPIRSIVYPALNIPIYWLLKAIGLSESGKLGDWLLIALPKILHGALASLTDIYLGELVRFALGSDYVTTAFLISLSSFFHALALSRSLSNSLETSLSTVAFAHYPWDASSKLSPQVLFNRSKLRKMIISSALACMIRPTNAVIWVFLYFNLFIAVRKQRRIATAVMGDIVVIGLLAILLQFGMDSLYYSRPTFTPFNFLKTNMTSVSLFYGANTWHYYLTQGIPILCTTALPFTVHGVWTIPSKTHHSQALKTMLSTVIWTVAIYSLAGHKEWRFLHPILPLLHVFATKSLVDLSRSSTAPRKKSERFRSLNTAKETTNEIMKRFGLPNIPRKYLATLLLTLPVSLYVILFYCSGPVSVLSYFRALPRDELGKGTVGFLMPCHSTPGYSYLHRQELVDGGMWALGCEPPLGGQDLSTYKDQTDVFFDSPKDYLSTYFPITVNPAFPPSPFPTSIPGEPAPIPTVSKSSGKFVYPWKHEWPRYLVFFGDLLKHEGVKVLLEGKGYREVWKAGREWEGEGHRKGAVRVWRWSP